MLAIQISNPYTIKQEETPSQQSFCCALQDIFILESERAILFWNEVPIPICYKYDLSWIIEDVIQILLCLHSQPSGKETIDFFSDTFRARWDLEWNLSELHIHAEWIALSGGLEELANEDKSVTMDKKLFLMEWAHLLSFIQRAIQQNISRPESITGFLNLQKALKSEENPLPKPTLSSGNLRLQ